MKVSNIIAVGLGGSLGTIFRYLVNMYYISSSFPKGTIIENLTGSFLLGIFTGIFIILKIKEWLKLGLGVGFCGGFTTMSTLAADIFILISYDKNNFLLYILVSIFGGIILAFIGLLIGIKLANIFSTRKVVDNR